MTSLRSRGGEWLSKYDTPEAREKFWLRVSLREADDCWPWLGAKIKGYGYFSFCAEAQSLAHRYSYFIEYGSLPDGLLIRHRCDNPVCVNPQHLLTGTIADNARDAVERGKSPWHRVKAARAALASQQQEQSNA